LTTGVSVPGAASGDFPAWVTVDHVVPPAGTHQA
jgi:hypothetical protein